MRCPRCERETNDRAVSCAGCGAPLALGDEPAPPKLDVPLALDRRTRREGDDSHWDLGAALARVADPSSPEPGRVDPGGAGAPGMVLGAGAGTDTGRFSWGDAGPQAAIPEPDVGTIELHLPRAPTWRRVCAWAVDVLPLVAAVAALGRSLIASAAADLPAPPVGPDGLLDLAARESTIVLSLAALLAVALAVYTTLAHALAGATLGKWLLRLRVAGPDGARPGIARSAARSALGVLSVALLGTGFLLALFTRSGRALHDFLARTWVVEAR